MLNSVKKIRALRDNNNKYSNSRFVRKKNSERNKKPDSYIVSRNVRVTNNGDR